MSELVLEKNNVLPIGWEESDLDSLSLVITKGSTPTTYGFTYQKTGINFIKVENIVDGWIEQKTIHEFIDQDTNNYLKRSQLEENDILFSIAGTIGRTTIIRKIDLPANTNQAVAIIRCPWKYLNPKYVRLILDSPTLFNSFSRKSRGVGIYNLSLSDIKELVIPIPPLNEQKRIVAKIEDLFSRLEESIETLKKVKLQLNEYKKSVLKYAFEGKFTEVWREKNAHIDNASNIISKFFAQSKIKVRQSVPEEIPIPSRIKSWKLPNSWTYASTAELLKRGILVDLKDGNHGANHPKSNEFTHTGLPFIMASHVNNFLIDYNKAPMISGKPLEKLKVGFAKKEDVIFTHKASIGRVAIADRDCVLSPQTTYYRTSNDILYNRYLMWYLASNYFSEQINPVKSQTTRDFVSITKQYNFFHRIAPIEEQKEIVKEIEYRYTIADNIWNAVETTLIQYKKLGDGILKQAFEGKLVPQNPNDESAEILLQKIKQEKEQLIQKQKVSGEKKNVK